MLTSAKNESAKALLELKAAMAVWLPELEELADRFGIIQKGRWKPVHGDQVFFTRAELRSGFTQNHWWLECSDPSAACQLLGANATLEAGRIRLAVVDREEAAAAVGRLVQAGHKIYHFEAARRSLDDLALRALGEETTP